MTIIAAGIMILTGDNQVLFLKRGNSPSHPHEFCFPGGQLEDGENLEECAIRETLEETGGTFDKLVYHTRSIAPDPSNVTGLAAEPNISNVQSGENVDFTTFCVRVKEPFIPTLCDESTGYAWCSVDDPPEPLHPGCRVALARLSMDEQQIAQAVARDELTSPQQLDNSSLFNMRITGTGVAYRHSLDEFVWRDPALYLNPQFVERCSGLPVIWEHPPKGSLDSKEFGDRIIGTIVFAYIKGDEVWGVARIIDAAAVLAMTEKQLSTSPAVVFSSVKDNSKMTLEDGSTMLIEGKPSLLDHLAVCELGVWDKGKAPEGIIVTDSSNCDDSVIAAASVKLNPKPNLDPERLKLLDSQISLLDVRLRNKIKENSFG